MLTTLTIRTRYDPFRSAKLDGDGTRTFDFWDPQIPGGRAQARRPDGDLTIPFDASGRFRQSDPRLEPAGGEYIRVAPQTPPTALDGLWLQVGSHVHADTAPDAHVGTRNIASATEQGFAEGVVAGVAQERARWLQWLQESPDVTPPADSDPGMGEGIGDEDEDEGSTDFR